MRTNNRVSPFAVTYRRGKEYQVKRKVVSMSYYRVRCKPGYGSVMMELECGHSLGRKQSEAKNVVAGFSKVTCRQCPAEGKDKG